MKKGSTQTTLTASGSSMSASSAHASYPATYGYLGHHGSRSWRPTSNAGGSYLEMNLDSPSYVTAITTQGGSNNYVSTYTARYYNTTSESWVRPHFAYLVHKKYFVKDVYMDINAKNKYIVHLSLLNLVYLY